MSDSPFLTLADAFERLDAAGESEFFVHACTRTDLERLFGDDNPFAGFDVSTLTRLPATLFGHDSAERVTARLLAFITGSREFKNAFYSLAGSAATDAGAFLDELVRQALLRPSGLLRPNGVHVVAGYAPWVFVPLSSPPSETLQAIPRPWIVHVNIRPLSLASAALCRRLAQPADTAQSAVTGELPEDIGDYVPASQIYQARFDHYEQFRRWLKDIPESQIRRYKPRPNRLLIHIGDWHKYWQTVDEEAWKRIDEVEARQKTPRLDRKKAGRKNNATLLAGEDSTT
ncbi:MAG: hypothetical protein H5T92_00045 [Synergistales bacterium]|nr:hypothetical protein [Synergistales bacterium]